MGTLRERAGVDFGKSHINLIPSSEVTSGVINDMYEIEQDIWARFLGEYLSCNDCGNIMSKNDIYMSGHIPQIGVDIKKYTVAELERILGNRKIPCDSCKGETSHIFGEDFKEEIISRTHFEQSYLIIQKSVSGRVLGFASSYVSDFDTIYERELDYYYSQLGRDAIREKIKHTLNHEIPKNILCFAAIGNAPDVASLQNLYTLFQHMFQVVEKKSPGLIGVYETVLGSITHTILETCGANRMNINSDISQNVNSSVNSDIFIHKEMAQKCLETLGRDCRVYIRKYAKNLRKIRE